MNTIGAANSGRSGINGFDGSFRVADFEKIANPDRAFPHQNPATNEIIDDVLGAETNTNRDSAGNKSKCRERHIQKVQDRNQQDRQNQDEINTPAKVNKIRADLMSRKSSYHQSLEPARQKVTTDDDDCGEADLSYRDRLVPDGHQRMVQKLKKTLHHREFGICNRSCEVLIDASADADNRSVEHCVGPRSRGKDANDVSQSEAGENIARKLDIYFGVVLLALFTGLRACSP